MGMTAEAAGGMASESTIVDLSYVKGCLERWARWSVGASGGGNVSLTGKLMDGVRSNVCPVWLDDIMARRAHDPFCPLCGGRGRLRLDLQGRTRKRVKECPICDEHGKFLGDWCFRCQGTRMVEIPLLEVNPAAIKSTRSVGGRNPSDAVCLAIDDLVGAWRAEDATIWLHRVVVQEYFRWGTQRMKAERLKVSLSFFEKRLHAAHASVEALLQRV